MKTEQEILNKIAEIDKMKLGLSDAFLKISLDDRKNILKWVLE